MSNLKHLLDDLEEIGVGPSHSNAMSHKTLFRVKGFCCTLYFLLSHILQLCLVPMLRNSTLCCFVHKTEESESLGPFQVRSDSVNRHLCRVICLCIPSHYLPAIASANLKVFMILARELSETFE
jgi:hypothetical protein